MKRIMLLCIAFVLAAGCAVEGSAATGAKPEVKVSAETAKPELKTAEPEFKTLSEKFSYLVGMNVARSLVQVKDELDMEILVRGLKDGLAGKEPVISQEEARNVFEVMRERSLKKAKEQDMKNLKIGEDFLAANKKKEGVVTTTSGLQYLVLKKGEGPKPTAADVVSVHYRGTLIDGTEFDSSYKRGKPAAFPVRGVIAGWTEALQLMNVGTKCRLFIPSKLAYGEGGAGAVIGPNAALVFEVELLAIDAPPKGK